MAAEWVFATGQCNFGCYYECSIGIEINYAEVLYWCYLATEQRHTRAQHRLGICYEDVIGVEQGFQQALKWVSARCRVGLNKQLHEALRDSLEDKICILSRGTMQFTTPMRGRLFCPTGKSLSVSRGSRFTSKIVLLPMHMAVGRASPMRTPLYF